MKRLLKNLLLHIVFPAYYRCKAAGTKVDSLIAFVEIRYENLSDNLQPLYDAYKQDGRYRVEQGFLMLSSGNMVSYVRRCFSVIRLIAGAKLVFVDESSNMLAALPIRKETGIVQVWHGCGAFKRFGYGLQHKPKERYYNEYALVTVSSQRVADIYKNAMMQPADVVKALGISRTDCFFDEAFLRASREKIEELLPFVRGRKSILYAPTFRGNAAEAKEPEKLNIEHMYQALSDEYVVLYKAHPLIGKRAEVSEKYHTFFVDVSDLLETDALLSYCDLCITDYSSLIFEYSLFERPMIFYAYDYAEYDDARGFYYPYEEFVPGPICKNTGEVIDAILRQDDGWAQRVKTFKKTFMDACDGHATQRIKQYLEKL